MEATDVFESDGIEVWVDLEGPSYDFDASITPPDLTIQIDSDFDGNFSEDETYRVDGEDQIEYGMMESSHGSSAWFVDDGPAPGNNLTSDEARIRIAFGTDVIETSVTVHTRLPEFHRPVTIGREIDELGNHIISANVGGFDVSETDEYRLISQWGGVSPGPLGLGIVANCVTDANVECNRSRTFDTDFVYQTSSGGATASNASVVTYTNPLPAVFTLKDDDAGESRFYYSEMTIDGNYNDDDGNFTEDHRQSSIDFVDNDLTGFSLSDLWPTYYDLEKGSFFLEYDTSVLRIWDSPGKENLILPTHGGGDGGDYCSTSPMGLEGPYETISEDYEDYGQVWIEGLGGSTSIVMGFQDDDYYSDYSRSYGGEVLVTVDAPLPDPGAISVEQIYWGVSSEFAGSLPSPSNDEPLWEHNRHRWTTEITGDLTRVSRVDYWAIPYEDRAVIQADADLTEDPLLTLLGVGGNNFGAMAGDDCARYLFDEPPSGNWVYMSVLHYSDADHNPSYRTSEQIHHPMLGASVDFIKNGNPNFTDGIGKDTIFPEQNPVMGEDGGYSLGPSNDIVTIMVTLDLPMPTGFSDTLVLKAYDPDNPVDGLRDLNDQNGPVPNDNYRGDADPNAPGEAFIGATLSESALAGYGQTARLDFVPTIDFNVAYLKVDEPQPNNNWIVAMHEVDSIVKSLEFQGASTLVRQTPVETTRVPFLNTTDQLVVNRTLWLEFDSLPNPASHLCNAGNLSSEDDPCNFERVDPTEVISFLTDVHLDRTGIVPKEATYDTKEISSFLQASGHLKPNELGTNTPFMRQTRDARDQETEPSFWSVQLVTAYESHANNDADGSDASFEQWVADRSLAVVGFAYGLGSQGPSVVYAEEVRDLVANDSSDLRDAPSTMTIVASHEIMHRFYGPHGTAQANEDLMNGAAAMASSDFIVEKNLSFNTLAATPLQFRVLQSRDRPR